MLNIDQESVEPKLMAHICIWPCEPIETNSDYQLILFPGAFENGISHQYMPNDANDSENVQSIGQW